MGKVPDQPAPKKRPAAVTPESADVKAAGQRKVDEIKKKKGRTSTFLTDRGMKTGFAGGFDKTTGSV